MSGIDRRGLLKGAMVGAALVGIPSSLQAMPSGTSLFIYDGRFAEARQFAAMWQTKGIKVLNSQVTDLGHAWRGAIAKQMDGGGEIAGLTMWVDSFICETFGREFGMTLDRTAIEVGNQLHRWVLR